MFLSISLLADFFWVVEAEDVVLSCDSSLVMLGRLDPDLLT